MKNPYYRSILVILMSIALVASCGKQPTTIPAVSPSNTPVTTPAIAPTSTPEKTQLPETQPLPTQAGVTPAGTPTPPSNAAALVNGQPISLQEYETQVVLAMDYLQQQQDFDPNTEEGKAAIVQLRRQVLSWMIDQALIEQAAAQEGVSVPDDKVEAEINRLIGDDVAKFDEWLKSSGLTRDSFKIQLQHELLSAALQERIVGSLSTVVEQVHARHILLLSEEEAMNVLLKLRSGENFAVLAQQYSQDKGSSQMGGDLGFFPRGIMPIEIEAVAFGLNPGQISGIIKTDFGYHIVEVVEKDPARKIPDDMVASWQQKTFLRWLEAQRSVAKVQYLVPLE